MSTHRGLIPENVSKWFLVAYLAVIFLTGGGSRDDIQSLVILRPIAVLVCAFAVLQVRLADLERNRTLIALMSATLLLVALHLIPLPPAVWQSLPYHDLLADIDDAAGLGDVWRPLSIAPERTWNAFYSLFVPLSVLLLLIPLDRRGLKGLLLPVICIGLLSGFVGLLQITGGANSALYLYAIHNEGSAVGLFSNRNHQAAFLASLFPMLAVYASQPVRTVEQFKLRALSAAAAGFVLVPLLLVTGSRSGLILGFMGLVSVPLIFRRPATEDARRRKQPSFPLIPVVLGGAGVMLAALLALLFSRAEALARLASPEQMDDVRFQVFGPILDMVWRYFPFGSGLGTFVEAYKRDEPFELLKPEYLNHAHNDYLELALTGGIAALLLLAAAVTTWFLWGWRAWRSSKSSDDVRMARMGFAVIGLLLTASAVDYPLRTPSLACLLVLAAVWLRSGITQNREQTSNGLEVPSAFR